MLGLPDLPLSASGLLVVLGYWKKVYPCEDVWIWLSKVCGRRGHHFCWIAYRQNAGRYRQKPPLPHTEGHVAHQAGDKWGLLLGWWMGCQSQLVVLARNGVGLFPLILLSSMWCSGATCLPRPVPLPLSPPSAPQLGGPHSLICLGHILTCSFGPRIMNNNAPFHSQQWPNWTWSYVITLVLSSLAGRSLLSPPVFSCNLLLQHKLVSLPPPRHYAQVLKSLFLNLSPQNQLLQMKSLAVQVGFWGWLFLEAQKRTLTALLPCYIPASLLPLEAA